MVRQPDRLYMQVDGLSAGEARLVAHDAVAAVRRIGPKVTGNAVRRMTPIWGEGWFGVHWVDPYIWNVEMGIRPFTMRRLAGKTIPMWLDDPTGKIRQQNPKARRRVTESGKNQVLIFRRATHIGQRKTIIRGNREVSVPTSFPGAPGRIAIREARHPWTRSGKVAGRIAPTNVGIRWRHPGILGRGFIHEALLRAAFEHGLEFGPMFTTAGVR